MYDINKYKCYGYDEKNEDGSIRAHCVVAISTYAGKTVKGYAKCDPIDTFDIEKGKKLAAARCNLKIAEKRVKRAKEKEAIARAQAIEAKRYQERMEKYAYDSEHDLAEAKKELTVLMETL